MGQTWSRVIARQVPEATLVAVSGGRGARDVAAEHGAEVLDQDGLLARSDIDAVVVATPVPTHRPIAEAAGVRLAVCSQHRYRGAPMAAKTAIDAGRIGDIRMIRVFGPNAGWDIP